MPHTWTQALDAYRYPVNLADFVDSEKFPGWFQFNTQSGDRDTTVAFEYHFRQYAREAIEPWLEVIYWKLYSQPGRRNRLTRQVANHFVHEGTTPTMLSEAWLRYTEKPTCANFDAFRRLFGFATPVIATVATFPAFLRPEDYPMVDTRITKWVGKGMTDHNLIDHDGPQLIAAPFLNARRTVLTMADFDFMQRWIAWCRHVAVKLTALSDNAWRARDVEMAVFYAWGNRRQPHPAHHLNPLGPVPV